MKPFHKKIAWLIIFFGAFLRISQHLFNRSLWLDEAFVSLNIIHRPYSKLLEALDFNQGGPAGFLTLTKFFVQIFGDSEFVLRLFPFACSLISLFLFYKLVSLCLEPKPALVALSLFAVNEALVSYASEVKQYSSDVAMTLILYLLAFYILQNDLTVKSTIASSLIGALIIWFSHPAIFVLIGVGITLFVILVNKKLWKKVDKLFICFFVWVLSFVLLYLANLSKLNANAIEYFGIDSFMPFPPDFDWVYKKLKDVFDFMQLKQHDLPQTLFVIGAVYMFFKKRAQFFLITSAIPATLIVSSFHKYPFVHRLLLFLVPLYLIYIGEGTEWFFNLTSKISPLLPIVLAGFLLYQPLQIEIDHLYHPRTSQEIKPVLSFIKEHEREGDLIYVYHSAQYAFKCYAKRFGFNDDFVVELSEYSSNPMIRRRYEKPGYNTVIVGVSSPGDVQKYIDDLNQLKGNNRVWILFSHVWSDEGRIILNYLDSVGKRLLYIEQPGYFSGSSAYLYDLSLSDVNPLR